MKWLDKQNGEVYTDKKGLFVLKGKKKIYLPK